MTKMQKKILFVFPQLSRNGSPIAVCCNNVMEAMLRQGCDVTILVNDASSADRVDVDGNCACVYHANRTLRRKLQDYVMANSNWKCSVVLKYLVRLWNFLLYSLDVILFLCPFSILKVWPNDERWRAKSFYKKAKELHAQKHFDLIISSFYPFATMIAIRKLKVECNDFLFVPYMLDTLAGGVLPTTYVKTIKRLPLLKYIPSSSAKRLYENRCIDWETFLLEPADKIIALEPSKSYHDNCDCDKTYYSKFFYLNIPYLISPKYNKDKNFPFLEKDKVNIAFGGIFYPEIRNPEWLFNFIRRVNRHDIIWHFFGCQGGFYKNEINTFIADCADSVRFWPRLAYDDYIDFLFQADFLLNIGNHSKYACESKIFEYLSLGKPIIATVKGDSASLEILRKYKPYVLFLDENEGITSDIVEGFYDFINEFRGKIRSFESVKNIYSSSRPEAFAEAINCFCNLSDSNGAGYKMN